jgi:hypothetical protein
MINLISRHWRTAKSRVGVPGVARVLLEVCLERYRTVGRPRLWIDEEPGGLRGLDGWEVIVKRHSSFDLLMEDALRAEGPIVTADMPHIPVSWLREVQPGDVAPCEDGGCTYVWPTGRMLERVPWGTNRIYKTITANGGRGKPEHMLWDVDRFSDLVRLLGPKEER